MNREISRGIPFGNPRAKTINLYYKQETRYHLQANREHLTAPPMLSQKGFFFFPDANHQGSLMEDLETLVSLSKILTKRDFSTLSQVPLIQALI